MYKMNPTNWMDYTLPVINDKNSFLQNLYKVNNKNTLFRSKIIRMFNDPWKPVEVIIIETHKKKTANNFLFAQS